MLILSNCRYCQLFKGHVVPETIPISRFKAACLSLLRQVKKTGKTILVTRKGEPIALVTPPPLRPLPLNPESWPGTMRKSISIKGDIISPVLDESDWEALQD
jgi:prevent-host-death family protein